jgi:hypothetical protein
VTDTPFRLADMTPRKRRPWLIPLLAGLAVAVLAAGGLAAYAAATDTSPQALPSAVVSSPVLLSEYEACARLNPLLVKASEIYAAFVKSNEWPKSEDARRIADAMREIRKVAPPDMGPDIGQIVKGLVLLPGGGAGIDFQDWQNAGLNLSTRCLGAT